MHVEIFNMAKKHYDSEKNIVVGGYLVPTTDEYVSYKLNDEAISLTHRNKMIEILIKDSDFIDICPWGFGTI